ncbi:type VI secretion system-associated protein TagF, partial [Noviherbaspirillum denitrificans]
MMVLPFRRADTGLIASYTLYGKLPNRADFVRVNADHAAAAEFDELIQRTFERLAYQDRWEESYDTAKPVEFQYVSRDLRHIMIGILAPSRDQAGRRYPLVATAILPSDSVAGYTHVAPIAYEVFFDGLREQVMSAVENSVEALSCRQFLESQLRANDTAAADLELAESVVARFMHATPAKTLAGLLAAVESPPEMMQALLNLAFYRAFLRRFDTPATNQVMQLPLPAGKGERALVACAWLSTLDALWRGRRNGDPWRANFVVRESSPGRYALAAVYGRAQERFTALMLGGAFDASCSLDLSREQPAWTNHRL